MLCSIKRSFSVKHWKKLHQQKRCSTEITDWSQKKGRLLLLFVGRASVSEACGVYVSVDASLKEFCGEIKPLKPLCLLSSTSVNKHSLTGCFTLFRCKFHRFPVGLGQSGRADAAVPLIALPRSLADIFICRRLCLLA